MIETVFALILSLNGYMIEHVYKKTQRLFEIKRIAQNEVNPEQLYSLVKKYKLKQRYIWTEKNS